MIRALLAKLLGHHPALPAAHRPESESDRVAARIRQLRATERNAVDDAPYWCRACAQAVYHPQCPICRGRTWARQIGMHNTDVFDRGGAA